MIQIINPIKFNGWDDLISSSGLRASFISSSWARVFFETYGYCPYYFSLIRDGSLEGLMPLIEVKSNLTGNRAVSLPFTDYCNPLISDKHVFNDFFKEVVSFGNAHGWKYVEFRGGREFLEAEKVSSSYYLHEIEIFNDEERNLKLLRDSTRRNINKATRSDVVVRKRTDLNAIKAFYHLHKETRKKHGVPPQPFNFFKNIHKHIIDKGEGIVLLAEHKNIIVAGALFLSFRDEAIYKYGSYGLDQHKTRTSNLIMWEAIKWCSENGIKRLSLGRTDLDHEGLLQFKRGWGGKESLINYYRFDLKSELFTVEDSGINLRLKKLFQLTPMPILTKVGEIGYRHFG